MQVLFLNIGLLPLCFKPLQHVTVGLNFFLKEHQLADILASHVDDTEILEIV